MDQVEVQYGAASEVGQVRVVNEDACLAAPPVFVVADGMGGHAGGDVASRIVIEEFASLTSTGLDPRRGAAAISETLRTCQRRIMEYAAAQRASGAPGWYSGTTAVIALLVEGEGVPHWLLANLGDSRAYRLSDGALHQISVDHSVVQELLDAGRLSAADVATHPDRHVITRALGGPDEIDADFFLLPVAEVGRLLLCSDGVTGMLDDQTLRGILTQAGDAREAADRVVSAAVRAGGHDNATAVVVDVMGLGPTHAHHSEQQRAKPEEKLGALP